MPPETPHLNPYGAPQAPVGDYIAGDRAVLETARSVAADHGMSWYREGWRLFKLSPGAWIGMWVVFAVILLVISIVPLIGSLAVAVLTPVFVGGAMIAARNADRNNGVRFGDLFAAFNGGRVGPLMLIGLIQLALSLIFFLLLALIVGFGGAFAMFSGEMSAQAMGSMMGTMAVVGVLSLIFFVPVTNAVWLGSALAALEGAGAMDAFRRGLTATLHNILPLLVFVLITFVLAIVASIPLGLGWFVLGPVILTTMYAQFVDLFDAAGPQA